MYDYKNNIVAMNNQFKGHPDPCCTCMKQSLCPVSGLGGKDGADVCTLSTRTYRASDSVIQAGDEFDSIYVVRSGFFKSSFIDASGEMQVTGFHFPGEVFGIDGIDEGYYGDTVTALDTGSLCKIPFAVFTGAATQSRLGGKAQDYMLSLVKLMSRAVSRDRLMIFNLGKMDSRRRFAVFLSDIADRMGISGYSEKEFNLCMSRTDISNYLCLAIETVSRLFSQFHALGIIHVERRQLKILDGDALRALAQENDSGLLDMAS